MIKQFLAIIIVTTTTSLTLMAQSPTELQDVVKAKDSTVTAKQLKEGIEDVLPTAEVPTLRAEWDPVLIDHSIGIRLGWGTGMIRREPNRQSITLPYPLWNGGITYRFDIPEQKYVGTMSFELYFTQKGYAYNLLYDGTQSYTRRYDMIELPILWQPYLPLDKRGSRIYLSAGPFISYTLSSWEKSYDRESGQVYSEGEVELDSLDDYFWNYGISAGLGFYLEFGRWGITIDGRYEIQLSDMERGPEYVTGNPFRTPVDHIGASIGVQYKFSIGKESKKNK